jgi:AraC family transcriptional regulator
MTQLASRRGAARSATVSVERVMRAVVAIERDLDADLSLPELADQACLSPFHFHRLFAALVGEAPAEDVRRLRLERAAHELSTSDRGVAEIGREAGYGNQSAFTRAFGERFGCAPGEFRERECGRWAAPVEQRKLVGRVETITPLRVAFVRHVGPYDQVRAAFERLAVWAAARSSNIEPLFLGLAHDNPRITPASHLRFDCCVEVNANVRGEGRVGVTEVCGGEYASGPSSPVRSARRDLRVARWRLHAPRRSFDAEGAMRRDLSDAAGANVAGRVAYRGAHPGSFGIDCSNTRA